MVRNFAVIFPGQGSQAVGMLDNFADIAIVKETIDQASSALNYDLGALIALNSDDKLNKTEYTQPAILATSIALWRLWLDSIDHHVDSLPQILAGHSLGEYSALVAAEALGFTDAIKLVAKRGELMQQAVPYGTGAMAAILMLDNAIIENICQQAAQELGLVVSCANYNALGQTVIAGDKAAVIKAVELCKEQGAKMAKLLDVSVPSHCALMQSAANEFTKFIDKINITHPKIKIINNVDVSLYENSAQIRELLVKQLIAPVRWVETIQKIANSGINLFLECGPGQVLTKLCPRINKDLVALKLEEEL